MEEKITLSEEQWAEIDGYLFEEKKLLAIKMLTLMSRQTLQVSQEIINQRFEKLKVEQPERFNKNDDNPDSMYYAPYLDT